MIINPIISASGGMKPQIVVTAPTGSTVTCTTPGGIIIQGIEVSGTWTFSDLPGLGTYTINASNGTQSEAESVVIDRIGVYQVSIKYPLYLYNLGDECAAVTGGWSASGYTFSGLSCTSGKKNNDHIDMQYKGVSYIVVLGTSQLINFDGFSSLCVDGSTNMTNSMHIGATTSKSNFYQNRVADSDANIPNRLDISGLTGKYYVYLENGSANSERTAIVTKVWLE